MAAAGRRCTTWRGASSRRSRPSSFRTTGRVRPPSSRSMTAMRDVTVEAELRAVDDQRTGQALSGRSRQRSSPDRAARLGHVALDEIGADSFLFLDWKASDGSAGRSHFSPLPYKAHRLEAPELALQAQRDGGAVQLIADRAKAGLPRAGRGKPRRPFQRQCLRHPARRDRRLTFTPDDPSASVDAAAFVVRDLHSSYASRSN